jgi:phytoene synthase
MSLTPKPLQSNGSEIDAVSAAYTHVTEITRTFAKTFYFASHFLPIEKRRACYAVYGFCRFVDDLIDEVPEEQAKTKGIWVLQQWNNALDFIYDNQHISPMYYENCSSIFCEELQSNNPIIIAWADTLRRFHIPRELPSQLIEGVVMDTVVNRFTTFDELYNYCYKVASVVGLMTSEIFGYSHPDALKHAIDLGIAMQLTNICRDIGEDLQKDRIYLPSDEYSRYNLTEQDFFNQQCTPQFKEYLEFNIERALSYYESADKGIPYLTADSRMTVQLMSTNYRRILYKIRQNDYDVFTKRASLSLSEKLLAVPRAFLRNFVKT